MGDRLHSFTVSQHLAPDLDPNTNSIDIFVEADLSALTQLRFLSIVFFPTPCGLVGMRHLQYLDISCGGLPSPSLMLAVRYLSAFHQLRRLKFGFIDESTGWMAGSADRVLMMRALGELPWPTNANEPCWLDATRLGTQLAGIAVPPSGLVELELNFALSQALLAGELIALGRIPTLRRLTCHHPDAFYYSMDFWTEDARQGFQQLEELTIIFTEPFDHRPPTASLHSLALCASLRSLKLVNSAFGTLDWLPALPLLESLEMRIAPSPSTLAEVVAVHWSAVSPCVSLQRLTISPFYDSDLVKLAAYLAVLPDFRSLTLETQRPCQLPSSFARQLAKSTSWTELHLAEWNIKLSNVNLRAVSLASATRFRIHHQGALFCIAADTQGRPAWAPDTTLLSVPREIVQAQRG